MSEERGGDTTVFVTTARQRVRTALELAGRRTPETSARVEAELCALASDAAEHGLHAIAELAQRGSRQAQLLGRDLAAMTACVRTLREIGRALDAMQREAPVTAAEPRTRPRTTGRVLVIDDSPLNIAVVCDLLERAAFETRQAEDSDAAVSSVARFHPDVVLADVQMPGTTPAELCGRIRAAAGGSTLQVLLFSGLPDATLAELAETAGADGFLSKERGPDAIVEVVTRACRKVVR